MSVIKIKICRKSQTEPAFHEVMEGEFAGELRIHGVAILEHGMESGRTSIGIAMQGADQKWYMTQIPLNMLEGVISAARGAEKHWTANPEKGA